MSCEYISEFSQCFAPKPTQDEVLDWIKREHGENNYNRAKKTAEHYNNFNIVLTGYETEKINNEVRISYKLTKLFFADKYGSREFEYKF